MDFLNLKQQKKILGAGDEKRGEKGEGSKVMAIYSFEIIYKKKILSPPLLFILCKKLFL